MSQWNLEGLQVEGMYLEDIPVKGKVVLSRAETGGYVFPHMDGYWTITPARYIIEGPRDGIFEGGLFY